MQLLRKHSPVVHGIRFTGENTEEVGEFVVKFGFGVYFQGAFKDDEFQLAAFFTPLYAPSANTVRCNVGDWIVEEPEESSGLLIVSGPAFDKLYRVVIEEFGDEEVGK